MKRLTLTLLLVFASFTAAFAQKDTIQKDTIEFSAEYLDSLDLSLYKGKINDYSMIGVNYGVTFSTVYFNPTKMGSAFIFNPTYFSLMYTHHEKMFNYIPYFGLTVGFSYSQSGARFKDNPDTGLPQGYIDGATYESMQTVEMPAMMQMHIDSGNTKFLIDLGGYIGYRLTVERSGIWLDEEYTNAFRDYERRFDYGVCGGIGFGVMLDPIELHFNILGRWSLQNLYEPDYYNPVFHPYNTYYYRYANPIDISATVGIYFQLSKRYGKTERQLRKEAKNIVYGTPEND